MRSFVLGLVAVLVLLVPSLAAQGMRDSGVDPRTYTSPSGEYALLVDPSARNGSGPATYRLSRQGTELWTKTHAFTWMDAFVCDDGASAGYAYTHGESAMFDQLGSFVVVVLDPKGAMRGRHATARTSSSFLHTSANPFALGLIPSCDLDRFVVRVTDEDVNRQSESWWPFRISTGEALAHLQPKDGQADTESVRGVLGAVRVRDTPLVLVHWHQYGEFKPARRTPMGSRFALIDETGTSVWTLDRPDEYAAIGDDDSDARLDSIRKREHGSIARWDEARRFDLDFVDVDQRVTFEVSKGTAATWDAREVGRRPAIEVEGEAEVTPDAEVVTPPTPLALVGVVDLETAKTPVPFVRHVSAFAFDGTGNVAFLHWEHEPYRVELGYADARGARIAEHALPALEGDRGRYESDIAWLADDRFVVSWNPYGHAEQDKARVFAVSARTGQVQLLVDDVGREASGLASCGNGGFVVLGDNRLDAFDADGKRLWKLTSADGLCGADHVAVLSDGRIVVSDRSGIQWIAADGEVGRYDKLEKRWGREPRYLCSLEAGFGGGLIVQDFDRSVSMDAGGKLVSEFVPRYRDGRRTQFRAPRAGPDGRIWTHERFAIVGLDARGTIETVIGEPPEVRRLSEAAAIALDREDRIHAVSERTGDVHVIDVAKGLVRVLPAPPDSFTDELSFVDTCVVIEEGSGVSVSSDTVTVRWAPDGSHAGTERAADEVRSWLLPGTKKRLVSDSSGHRLVDPAGAVLAKLERKPDGQWLRSATSAIAPDGSIAFLASRDEKSEVMAYEVVLYAADGTPRAQIPFATSGSHVENFAYDGARIVLVCGEHLHVHDVARGATTIYALPGIEGAKTSYWIPLLPSTRDEVWIFDGQRRLRRYALARK